MTSCKKNLARWGERYQISLTDRAASGPHLSANGTLISRQSGMDARVALQQEAAGGRRSTANSYWSFAYLCGFSGRFAWVAALIAIVPPPPTVIPAFVGKDP